MSRHHAQLNDRLWSAARKATLSRDKWTCCECGKYGNHVHHIIELQKGGAAYALDNLVVMCRTHHSALHSRPQNPEVMAWLNFLQELVPKNRT